MKTKTNKGALLLNASAGLIFVIFIMKLLTIEPPAYALPLALIGLILSYPLYKLEEWRSR